MNFSASAILSGTSKASFTIINGINYSPSTQITASGGGGSAIATVVSGSITAYTSLNGGSGYTSLPSIVIYSAGCQSFWKFSNNTCWFYC